MYIAEITGKDIYAKYVEEYIEDIRRDITRHVGMRLATFATNTMKSEGKVSMERDGISISIRGKEEEA